MNRNRSLILVLSDGSIKRGIKFSGFLFIWQEPIIRFRFFKKKKKFSTNIFINNIIFSSPSRDAIFIYLNGLCIRFWVAFFFLLLFLIHIFWDDEFITL